MEFQLNQERERSIRRLISTPEERASFLADLGHPELGPAEFNISNDPYNHVMRTIFSKWKPFILRAIYVDGGTYFSRFFKQLPITQKVLSQNLKEMQSDGLITRNVKPEVPPRVEYCLTTAGKTLVTLLDLVYDWGWNDMRRKGLPVDALGEMWHGYREPDVEAMTSPFAK